MSNFAELFHSLGGETVGERKKSLQILLKDRKNVTEEIEAVSPKNYLETLLKVDVLVSLKKNESLLELLRSGDDIIVSKIIKQKWFIQFIFNKMTPEKFTEDLLPNLSYSVRMKLLKKCCIFLDSSLVNALFDSVLNRYGLQKALCLITGCSEDKIKDILLKHEVQLSNTQIIILFNKNQDLLEFYMDEFKKTTGRNYYDHRVFKYVAARNPELFFKLKEKNNVNIKVGRKTTKKIVELKKDDILSNPKNYSTLLKLNVVARTLQKDFRKIYLSVFPKNADNNFGGNALRYLQQFPKKRQFEVFSSTYKSAFGKDLSEDTNWMGIKYLLEICPSPEREKFAELYYSKTNDLDVIRFFPTDKATKILKEKINLTSNIQERSEILKTMFIQTSFSNNKKLNDFKAVLQYFCTRHRNEDKAVRFEVLNVINKFFDMKQFDPTIWAYINEIITVQRVKKEYMGNTFQLSFGYIEFLFKEQKPYKAQYEQIVKDANSIFPFSSAEVNLDLLRVLLLELIEKLPTLVEPDEIVTKDVELIEHINTFNMKCPQNQINAMEYPRLYQSFKASLSEDHRSYTSVNTLERIIKTKKMDNCYNELIELFWKRFSCYRDSDLLDWFIKKYPVSLANHFEKFIESVNNLDVSKIKYIRQLSFTNLDGKIVDYFNKQLKDVTVEQKNLKPLAVLMPTKMFLETVQPYKPTAMKVDLNDEEAQKLYVIQCEIAKSFRYCSDRSLVLPTVLEYCSGDYLGSAINSLYSLFYKVPENELNKIVEFLSKGAVSVRKHALFLACEVLNQDKILDMLKTAGAGEKNASSRKQIFSSSMKYFVKNPSVMSWELVKAYMYHVNKSDEETLNNMLSMKVPKKYQHLFVQTAWEFFEQKKEIPNVHRYKENILRQVKKDVIVNIPHEFSKNVIRSNFLDMTKETHTGITSYVVHFLVYCENKLEHLNFVFDIIKSQKGKHEGSCKFKELIFNFFSKIYAKRGEIEHVTNEFVDKFIENWVSVFNPFEAFNEFIQLKVLKMERLFGDKDDFLIQELIKLAEEMVAKYGPHILKQLAALISDALQAELNKKLHFLLKIIQAKTTRDICILVLDILKYNSLPSSGEAKELVDQILKVIKDVKDDAVQLYYHLYLRD